MEFSKSSTRLGKFSLNKNSLPSNAAFSDIWDFVPLWTLQNVPYGTNSGITT